MNIGLWSGYTGTVYNVRIGSVRPRLPANLDYQFGSKVDLETLSDLASKFFRQIFTSSTRGYQDEDNTTIRDDAIGLQIPMVGPRVPSTDITTWMQQLLAKLSLFVCRHLPVQNCNFWSTVLKPALPFTNYYSSFFKICSITEIQWKRAMNNHYCIIL